MMRYDADVIVVGAGPGGCATAIRLVQAGHDVLVIERDTLEAAPDITSGELLAPQTQQELAAIGVPIEGDWVLDRIDRVRNVYPDLSWSLHAFPLGFAYVQIDRGGLNAAMRRRLVEAGGRIICETTISQVELRKDAAVVRTREGAEYAAKVLVDAAGRNSPSLNSLNMKEPDPEFRQIAVALFFSSFADTPLHCWDRHFYGEHGAMISGSRIRPGLYRYILEADLGDKQAAGMKPVEFYEHVARTYDPWIYDRCMREPRIAEPWSMAPLAFRASGPVRDRLLLVGDAAGYLSPITGQGIEIATRAARLAAQTLDAAIAAGDFSRTAFESYVQGRQAEVAELVDNVRRTLHVLRDRDALLRAARDDAYCASVLMPLPVTERGSLHRR